MPYVYREVRSLEKAPLVAGGDCVALIKALAPGLQGKPTLAWREGARVVDTSALLPGTAIATFDRGRYPNKSHGNHAAFFVAYAGKALWVMDQWKNDGRKPWVSKRLIYPGRKWKDGSFVDPSNSAEAFSVIELQ